MRFDGVMECVVAYLLWAYVVWCMCMWHLHGVWCMLHGVCCMCVWYDAIFVRVGSESIDPGHWKCVREWDPSYYSVQYHSTLLYSTETNQRCYWISPSSLSQQHCETVQVHYCSNTVHVIVATFPVHPALMIITLIHIQNPQACRLPPVPKSPPAPDTQQLILHVHVHVRSVTKSC